MAALTVSGLAKAFGPVPVLHDVSLSVTAGTRAAVVGVSGSGKSTLLRLVAGFEHADAGTVQLGPRTLTGPGAWVPAHRRGIAYVAQDGALFPHLSVERNIRFGLPRGARAASRVSEVMELVSLAPDLATRYPHELSGGQQQRVALARALAPGPQVILLDEPFSALDTGLREQTRRAVVDALEHSEVTTVLVTHDQDEALTFGQQIAIIDGGRIVQAGSPAQVFDDPATRELAAFLGPAVVVPATADAGHAESALGRIPIRHDRSGGSAHGVALVRPAQLTLACVGPPNGVVEALQWRGSHVDVSVRAGTDGAVLLAVRVPAHEAPSYEVGSAVSTGVSGGCLFYPAG